MRRGAIVVALGLGITLAGCQGSVSMPVPSGSATSSHTPSAAAFPSEDDLITPGGSTVIGKLGDPCALLNKSEIEKALGVAVLRVVRGSVDADGTQYCAWAMDAPGSTAAALGAFVGTLPSGGFGDVVNGLGGSGGVFGVVLTPGDGSGAGDEAPSEDGSPPGTTIRKLKMGGGGVVIASQSGGAAVVYDGIRTNLMLMDLVAGPASADALSSLLTLAYDRL